MHFKLIRVAVGFFILATCGSSEDTGFVYNGFQSATLALDGAGNITSTGLLQLTNFTSENQMGHAFYPNLITFKNSSINGTAYSFSTTFIFAMIPQNLTGGGNGMAFVVTPKKDRHGALPGPYLGLFNLSNMGNEYNHVFAVELDTVPNIEFNDLQSNHLGVDINGLNSTEAEPAGYHPNSNPGKRPFVLLGTNDMNLLDWVLLCWSEGKVLEARDPNLQDDYVDEEVELVLMLGLLCSHSEPRARPTMHQVMQYLEGEAPLPELSSPVGSPPTGLVSALQQTVDDLALAYASAIDRAGFWSSCPIPTDQLQLSGGR